MINALMLVPDVVITRMEGRHTARFQYWQQQAVVHVHPTAATLLVRVGAVLPDVNQISAINLQLMSLEAGPYLALVTVDAQGWLVQTFRPDWQFSDAPDRQCFLTQFAVATWLENEYRLRARAPAGPGFEV